MGENIQKRPNGKYRARVRDVEGREHARHFRRKVDAQQWKRNQENALATGTWVDPQERRITVEEWCQQWLAGYGTRRESTVRQARTHLALIRERFGALPLGRVRPSGIRTWLSDLAEAGYEPSYIYALHRRLSQVLGDAVYDGKLETNPCSRRTSPSRGAQRVSVATTEQIWALHAAMPERLRLAVLLGAAAGLRVAEACGLRVSDVEFLHRRIVPAVQYPEQPLKTETSTIPVPVTDEVLARISEQTRRWPSAWVLSAKDGQQCGPWRVQRALQRARQQVDGLAEDFRFQDLRHYYASMLLEQGESVKTVQRRLRHASAMTTLDTYTHPSPRNEESSRAAMQALFQDHTDSVRTGPSGQ